MKRAIRMLVATALIGLSLVLLGGGTPASAQGPITYFPSRTLPTDTVNDGRFLTIDGNGLHTLAGQTTGIEFSAPSGVASLQIGFFDGDAGKDSTGTPNPSSGHWDIGTSETVWKLYADPSGMGLGPLSLIGQWTSNGANPPSGTGWAIQSPLADNSMPDNDWWNLTIQTSITAQSPNGNYFYYLQISIPDSSSTSSNAFKLRTTGTLAVVPDTTWGFIGAMAQYPQDWRIIYPQWDGSSVHYLPGDTYWVDSPTTYDGRWTYYMLVPAGLSTLAVWDGDFDHGSDPNNPNGFPSGRPIQQCSEVPNPNQPPFPPFLTPEDISRAGVLAQGSTGTNPGNPPDENDLDAFRRTACVNYTVKDPSGHVYSQSNPSGNQDWQLFNISTGSPLPSGVWTIDVVGLDLSNTVYLHFPYPVCGINADGTSSCPPIYGSIGDRVWKDMNANGVQDSGEPNFPGVTVNLLNSSGAVIATKTTDANGNYLFDNLAAGDYKVQFVKPGGYVFTQQYAQGPDASMSNNNDSNPYPTGGSAGMTDTIRLGVGQNNLTIDAGLYQLAALGDFVWEDKNGNGIQDDGANSGIGGVTVKLYDGQNNFLGETTTAADGSYHFTNLPPGQYYLVFFKPDGYSFTTQYASGNPAASNDSNANVVTGKSDLIILNPGDNNITIDAGLYRPAALGDFVWFDSNGNGKQDGGEPGVAGATVTLLNADGTAAKDINGVLVPPQVTPSTGLYQFTNLAPGSYIVQFVAPNGYTFTQYLQGTDTAIDSNANPANSGKTGTITLVSGQTDNTWDAGLVGSLSLGDYVWVDTNGNGIQDDGNTGINGLTVQLLGSNGTTVLATTTTANNTSGQPGYYLFSNLVPGTYYVQFTAPSGYVYTTKYVNGSGSAVAGNDSNADTTSGKTDAIALNADGTVTINGANGTSGSNLGIDAGLKGTLSLGDYVWVDTNGNGIQDDGNTGINGLTVQLLGSNGTSVLATTTTANNTSGQPGYYLFSNLVPGTYYVQFTAPSGYVYTAKYVNGSGSAVAGNDSNADTTSGKTDAIALNANGTVTINGAAGAAGSNLGIDAGLYKPAALGDFVWNDGNGDGMQVTNSVGIAGVTVKLLDSGGNVIRTTTTDANGKYLFSNLAPGTYSVEFVKPAGYIFTIANAGTNDTIDSDANATTPNAATAKTGTYTLVSGETNLTVDAGVYQPASLGDYVWEDKNSNGLQDSGEPGIAGVTVKLLGSDGTTVLKTTTTDANGKYLFSDLAVGTYYVLFVQPTGYTGFTMANVGTNDAIDSDANTSTGRTGAYTLTAGQSNLTVDAGLKKTTTFVCVDNLVLNPSFELNTGSPPTNWTNGTAGDIGIYVDGKNVGYISGSGVMYQNVNVTPGYGYTLTFYSGSHVPQDQTVKLQYYNASNVALGTAVVHTITSDLEVTGFGGPYTLTLGAAPTDAKYLRISVSANGHDYAKVDALCLKAQPGTPPPSAPGTGTPGYWMNHPEAWPSNSITIGGKTYTKADAINLMKAPTSTDMTYQMFQHLVAAKLNVAVGNTATCISSGITAADDWMKAHPVGSGVAASSTAWQSISATFTALDNYNNGRLCAPSRG